MKNIYQLYEENCNRVGFKVRRTSWGRTVAVIKSIGGKTRGKLSGYAPYYGNQRVVAEIHTPSGVITDVLSCAGATSGSSWIDAFLGGRHLVYILKG